MIIRFRVENYKSIRDEEEFSFVAASLKENEDSVIEVVNYDLELLPTIGIYGANASGKSTALNALRFMRRVIVNSHRNWEPDGGVPREPFLLDSNQISKPSSFEIDFLLNKVRFTYGFTLDSLQILEEWLFSYPHGKKQELFYRDSTEEKQFTFSRKLTGENKAIQSLTRKNSLFLSAAAQNNHKILSPIFQWFSDRISFISDDDRKFQWTQTAEKLSNSKYRKQIFSLFTNCDLGITDVEVTEEEMPQEVAQMIERMFVDRPEFIAEIMSNKTRPKVALKHKAKSNKSVLIPLEEESRGTQSLFGLAGSIIQTLQEGGLLVIDELDSSLHPLIAVEIVKLFNSPESNLGKGQLFFTTHDTNILEYGNLRRDQVWFTEKDENGVTHLYPLTDYKSRKDENIKRGYLQGRYGAIPFLSNFGVLIEGEG